MMMMFPLFNILSVIIVGSYFAMLSKVVFDAKGFDYKKIIKIDGYFISAILIVMMISALLLVNDGTSFSSIPGFFIAMMSGHMLLSWLFEYLEKRYHQSWLRIIYFIGMVLTVLFSYLSAFHTYENETFDIIMMSTFGVLFLIIACTIPFAIVAALRESFSGRKNVHSVHNFKTSTNKMKHYRDHGLNEQEIIFFRQQMGEAKAHIENIERNMGSVAKLRVIETRHNTTEVCKQYFKDIVNEPERMSQAGLFLNKLLPSLEDLSAKYLEISSHVAKNKQTYLILEKSALTIEKLCETITENYVSFHQSLYNDLQDEIKFANKAIYKETVKENESLVDELVKDPFDREEEF